MPSQHAIMEMTLLPQNRVQARAIHTAQRRVPPQVISKARCSGFLRMAVTSVSLTFVSLCTSVRGDKRCFHCDEDAIRHTGKPAM